jgi:hypothetical protein
MGDRERPLGDPFAERERAPAWTPDKPGKTADGRILGFATWNAGFGVYPIVVLEQQDGKQIAIHAQRRVLVDELVKLRPTVGERLAVRFDGEFQRDSDGGSYFRYTVRMPDRPPLMDSLDWNRWDREGAGQ